VFRFFGRRRSRREQPDGDYPATRPYGSPPGGRRRRAIPDRILRHYVPLSVLEATDRVMRRYGEEQRECYVWWAGYFNSADEGQIVTAVYPETATEYGRIHLGEDQLRLMQDRLRALDQSVLVELHTHPPGAGGQNDVDAAHPAATYRGFVSIVVPDFAQPNLHDLRQTHVYEYLLDGEWQELTPEEVAVRFVIEESVVPVVV